MNLHKDTKKKSMFGGLFSGISKYFTRKVKSPSVKVDSRKYSPQVISSPAESPDFSNPLFDKEDNYDEEKEEFYKKFNVNETQIPEISRFDPVARALCLRPKQICKITRYDKISYKNDYYRICVS